MSFALFFGAAAFELAGCYLVWLAVRQNMPWLWLPALAALALFAWLLTLVGADSAGRTFVVYGAIYIVASLGFMAGVERVPPDLWDMAGVLICLFGGALIFFAPRG